MNQFFVSPDQIRDNTVTITGPDAHHICSVLRMRPGEQIRVCTGEDTQEYRCELKDVQEQEAVAQVLWTEDPHAELPCRITLYQGLPKGDKMELIIQKAVELGAYRIVPVETARAVVKLRAGREENKIRRWNAISESAAKQSKRMLIPQVSGVMSFEEALQEAAGRGRILFPYELAGDMEQTRTVLRSLQPGEEIAVFIGPEGGFEPGEAERAIAMGASVITLGRRILRTETAGMCVLSMLLFLLEP